MSEPPLDPLGERHPASRSAEMSLGAADKRVYAPRPLQRDPARSSVLCVVASFRAPIPPNQTVRGTVVAECRLLLALKFRDDTLGQYLAQFHAPLVERIDLPDGALHEHRVLVKRH